jgi:hypothetical protein
MNNEIFIFFFENQLEYEKSKNFKSVDNFVYICYIKCIYSPKQSILFREKKF